MSDNTFYITTAIDYPNGDPHLGHAFEKIISDFYRRYYQSRGMETYFVTGVDEHGLKIQEAAEAGGQSTRDFVDSKARVFQEFTRTLKLENDFFVRTSLPEHHENAREIYQKVFDKGYIYKGEYEGDYCVACETYYPKNQLEGGEEKLCPVHKTPTRPMKEETWFFKMEPFRDWLREHIEKNQEFIFPAGRRNEILSRLKNEIHDLSISRSTFSWGVPLPNDPDHVMYVWFDALSNYITALKQTGNYEKFWPADMHVIGKDIIWFHSVIWPIMLKAAEIPLPKQIYVHGFILDANGKRMSKSAGNVVDPTAAIEKWGLEPFRYYLIRAIAPGEDGNFSIADMGERYNRELANELGNLVQRVLKFSRSKLNGQLSAPKENPFLEEVDWRAAWEKYHEQVAARQHTRALDTLWELVRHLNSRLNDWAPWTMKEEADKPKIAAMMVALLRSLEAVMFMLYPILPEKTLRFLELSGQDARAVIAAGGQAHLERPVDTAFELAEKIEGLFPRLELEED